MYLKDRRREGEKERRGEGEMERRREEKEEKRSEGEKGGKVGAHTSGENSNTEVQLRHTGRH